MPDFWERFATGGVQGVSGISRAMLQKYLMDFEKEQQEGESRRAEEQLGLQRILTGARVTELGQRHLPEPEKAKTKTQVEAEKLAELFQDPDFARQYFLKGGTGRSPNITGIPSTERVVTGRERAAGEARQDWMENIETFLPGITFRSATPEQQRTELFDLLPKEQISDIEGQTIGESEIPMGDILKALSIAGEIPQEYQRPTGTGATALADSVEAARTDPAIAAALMDFLPGGQRQEDPEIAKARQALERGDIDQATFDEFVKEYNASYVR